MPTLTHEVTGSDRSERLTTCSTYRLVLGLKVSELGAKEFALSAEFPRLQGTSNDTYTFNVNLENNTGEQTAFNLTGVGPTGWSVDASPQLKQKASAISVDAGSSVTIAVSADPPDKVPASTYRIKLAARGGGRALRTELAAVVTGSAGDTSDITLVVGDKGAARLREVNLSASPPAKT